MTVANQAADMCQTAQNILDEESDDKNTCSTPPCNLPSMIKIRVSVYVCIKVALLTVISNKTAQENHEQYSYNDDGAKTKQAIIIILEASKFQLL